MRVSPCRSWAASGAAWIVALGMGLALPAPALASPFQVPTHSSFAPEHGAAEAEAPAEDSTVAEAKSEYKAGSDAYALGNYEVAVKHFERAYELSGEPALLFNLGQAYTRWYDIDNDVEHLKKARRLYENYVLNVGATSLDAEGQAEARADAQHRIREVDRRIAAHEEANPGSTGETDTSEGKPVHKKAWFWVALIGGAAVVAAGVTTAVILTRPSAFEPELGTIGSLGGGSGGLTLRF